MLVLLNKRSLQLLPLLFFVCLSLFGQTETIRVNTSAENSVSAATAKVGPTVMGQPIDPRNFLVAGERWEVRLEERMAFFHEGDGTQEQDNTKALDRKRQVVPRNRPDGYQAESGASASDVNIAIEDDFIGNDYTGNTPPDNGIAVSNSGKLVSVTNSSLRFMNSDGSVNLQVDFGDYLGFLDLDGSYFDPRVVFDPVGDKFIMVILNGNSPPNNVVIGFSTTDDPMDNWWFYVFDGAPDGSNNWFDYPNIGLSTNDLYVTGNLFNDQFQQSLIYQIEKAPGHLGQSISSTYYNNITDAGGNIDFNIVPISYGYNGSIGPGIYLMSTQTGGGNEAMVYFTTNSVGNDPDLEVYSVDIPTYYATVDGLQNGGNNTMDTGGTRLKKGYLADNTIHFVMNTSGENDDWTKIYYGQINTENQTGTGQRFGLEEYDYAYPSIIPIGNNPQSGESVIGFCRTAANIFPQYRVVAVDSDYTFSNSQLVKSGEAYVNFNNSSSQRWGDYTGVTRQHASNPKVFIAGNYATSENYLGAWIARIGRSNTSAVREHDQLDNLLASPNPVTSGQELRTSFTLENPTILDFLIVDVNGNVVRKLMRKNVKAGFNELSFSTRYLSSGTYFLVVRELGNNKNIHHETFLVTP